MPVHAQRRQEREGYKRGDYEEGYVDFQIQNRNSFKIQRRILYQGIQTNATDVFLLPFVAMFVS